MEILESASWVKGSSGGSWILCRDLGEVSVLDLVHIIPRRLPLSDSVQFGDIWTNQLRDLLYAHNQELDELLSISLRDVLLKAEVMEKNGSNA